MTHVAEAVPILYFHPLHQQVAAVAAVDLELKTALTVAQAAALQQVQAVRLVL
jgi:hypothetical protein